MGAAKRTHACGYTFGSARAGAIEREFEYDGGSASEPRGHMEAQ